MARTNKLYSLTEGDQALFEKTKENPNYFSSFYMKSPSTGTWWRPYAETERWAKGYEQLLANWKHEGEPDFFVVEQKGSKTKYQVVWEDDLTYPTFHNHHGVLFMPWQLEVYQRPQRICVIFGGFGSGKSVYGVIANLIRAATIPGFRAVLLAPNSTQAGDLFKTAMDLIYDTPYKERFLLRSVEKPFPKLTIGNDLVGQNILQFFPIGDTVGTKKVLSLRLDAAFIDQAESLDDIGEILKDVGSRMLGQFKGRPRMGRIDFSANSNENQALWELYDQGETTPQRVMAKTVATWDNPFITDEQLKEVKQDVGNDAESIRVHMAGGRPKGGGEHFSLETINIMHDRTLDERMAKCRENNTKGHVYSETRKVGVYEWRLPREEGHDYLVVADPGWDNPPKRNAAAILVWDYTDFPAVPAHLVGFYWVFGNNSPLPWITTYDDQVSYFNAHWANAIDATGAQSGYEKMVSRLQAINVQGMSLSGGHKPTYLNFAKTMAAKGYLKIPNIQGMFMQLSKYRLPDEHLAQDIVMAIVLGAGWLEGRFHITESGDPQSDMVQPNADEDRYIREVSEDRYSMSDRS
jgi:hypothetical protein